MNEICKKFPKQKASVLIITGNLLTFKITSMKKLRTSDRLIIVVTRLISKMYDDCLMQNLTVHLVAYV